MKLRAAFWATFLFPAMAWAAAPGTREEILVIGVTPYGGLGTALDDFPSNVQSATAEDIARSSRLDLSGFLNRAFANVFVNDAQNNPLQGDLQFRGFTASPLLGNPQGLAVYRDGVRQNDPFGDTVNWALIPEASIGNVEIVPGSNPLFGQNSLGGALVLRSKTGLTHAGGRVGVEGGAFGRVDAVAEYGGKLSDQLAVYAMGRFLDESGWRDFSPATAGQGYGNAVWQDEKLTARLGLTWASTDLIGNGPAPVQLLEQDRRAIFTRPDQTRNDFINGDMAFDYNIAEDIGIGTVFYVRRLVTKSLNGDDSDFEPCDDDPAFVCDDDGPAEDADDNPIPFSDAVDGATLNRSRTAQTGWGGAVQLNLTKPVWGRDNRLVAGVSLDRGRVQFDSSTELGRLDDTRAAIGSGILVEEAFTGLVTRSRHLGVFVAESWQATGRLRLNISGRYNDSHVRLIDQIGTALNGEHDFSRFNPAGGLTYQVADNASFYASYGASNRVPSPVELSCADPDDPCRLPNAFLSDPPLDQVVAQTVESGLRGRWGGVTWLVGGFNIRSRNDILFISAGALTNSGFFSNVGNTRRRGAELQFAGSVDSLWDIPVEWYANYAYTAAEFREDFLVSSPNHPAAVDGEIPVQAGDRLPGVPAHLFKAGAEIAFLPSWLLNADLVYNSSLRLRGDEGNLAPPVAGGVVVDMTLRYRLRDSVDFSLKVANLFNRKYESFGLFGEADEVLGDDFDDNRFLSPAARRGIWAGVGYRF